MEWRLDNELSLGQGSTLSIQQLDELMNGGRIGAVIVAAGLSSRMKAFKPLLPLGGSTLIRSAVSRLRQGGAAPVAVVMGHNAEPLRKHLSDLDVDCLFNAEYAATDMFRSACIGMAHMREKTDRLFFLPGDVPLFDPQSLALMSDRMNHSGSDVVIPAYQGRRGHPVLIDNRAIATLLAYGGDRGLKGAMATLSGAVLVMEVADEGVIMDADSPEDYRQLVHYQEERP
jgi:molybdenum cofactor cytidylyltransferase